ncbi:hypothetical protein T484DRAFT_1883530 [Baffinella frigidus]|nr:hypothetical protein T484DRAFT_1883530 [Cryptophyta sp. CCMP2293]
MKVFFDLLDGHTRRAIAQLLPIKVRIVERRVAVILHFPGAPRSPTEGADVLTAMITVGVPNDQWPIEAFRAEVSRVLGQSKHGGAIVGPAGEAANEMALRALPTLLFRRRDGSAVARAEERREAAMGLGSKVYVMPCDAGQSWYTEGGAGQLSQVLQSSPSRDDSSLSLSPSGERFLEDERPVSSGRLELGGGFPAIRNLLATPFRGARTPSHQSKSPAKRETWEQSKSAARQKPENPAAPISGGGHEELRNRRSEGTRAETQVMTRTGYDFAKTAPPKGGGRGKG